MSKALELFIPEATGQVRLFHISVPQEAVDELRARLRATRFPNEQPVEDWSQGVPLADAKALVQYWESRYDWRRFETELNSFPNFRTSMDWAFISPRTLTTSRCFTNRPDPRLARIDCGVHEDHSSPYEPDRAWWSRAQDAFHVVVPSLPGFGFSDKPTET